MDNNLDFSDPSSSVYNGIFGNPLGLPYESGQPPKGFESTTASQPPAPPISTIDSIWDTIKQDSLGAVDWTGQAIDSTYSNAKSVANNVYDDLKSGVSKVGGDVTAGLASPLQNIYWYLIIGVVIIGGALYFVGRGGAIGQVASLKPV